MNLSKNFVTHLFVISVGLFHYEATSAMIKAQSHSNHGE